MSTDADRFREEAIAAEQEEDWDLWMARSLDRLWEEAGSKVPAPFDGITEDNQQREGKTAMSTQAPVERGGIVRVLCDTTDDRRVTADVVAESVDLLGCGCWRMRATRPGPDIEGPYSYRGMEVTFQACGRLHDDGSQVDGTKVPEPVVIQRTA